MKYRSEIDGLRSLAVVPVVLYHFDLLGIRGGFLGVDVFFVISGFLIGGIIISEHTAGTFSFRSFYARRAKRILPALFLVLLVTFPLAWLVLFDDQLESFATSAVSAVFFGANFFFYFKSDYFNPNIQLEPLIHTWSLGVEEQFYLVAPLVIAFTLVRGRRVLLAVLVATTLVSLLAAELIGQTGSTMNFYLLPFRAWELTLGVIAFMVAARFPRKIPMRLAFEFLSLAALAVLVFSYFAFGPELNLPGLVSTVPVLATACILIFGREGTVTAKLLSAKPLVFIGLLSYSIYLWHQPILAFIKVYLGTEIPVPVAVLALAGIFSLAYVSWRFIEVPFRRMSYRNLGPRSIAAATAISIFALSGFTVSAAAQIGRVALPFDSDWQDTSDCFVNSGQVDASLATECLGDRGIILLGDSHAGALSKGFREELEDAGIGLLSLTFPGCFPFPEVRPASGAVNCESSQEHYWDLIGRFPNVPVVISTRWRYHLLGGGFDNGIGGVEKRYGKAELISGNGQTLDGYVEQMLRKLARTRDLLLISQIPEAGWDVPRYLATKNWKYTVDGDFAIPSHAYYTQNSQLFQYFDTWTRIQNLDLVSPSELFCEDNVRGTCKQTLNGTLLYRDSHHPSLTMSRLIAEKALERLQTLANQTPR